MSERKRIVQNWGTHFNGLPRRVMMAARNVMTAVRHDAAHAEARVLDVLFVGRLSYCFEES